MAVQNSAGDTEEMYVSAGELSNWLFVQPVTQGRNINIKSQETDGRKLKFKSESKHPQKEISLR